MDSALACSDTQCIAIKTRILPTFALQHLSDRSPAYHARARQCSGSKAVPGSPKAAGWIAFGHATDRGFLPGYNCPQSMVHNDRTSTFEYRWLANHELRFTTGISKSRLCKNR